ncbi:hypothetical protein [Sorangium sp. So ce887]|uniref:hypothetical protein n=1 Tax=Sorangium sp. So ce887 TaxID=3133324 RepID=UPI003F63FC02
MTTLPKGPTSNILVNLQGIFDPIGFTLRMRERYGDPMSLPKMDGKPVLATGSVEGLRAVFAAPPNARQARRAPTHLRRPARSG